MSQVSENPPQQHYFRARRRQTDPDLHKDEATNNDAASINAYPEYRSRIGVHSAASKDFNAEAYTSEANLVPVDEKHHLDVFSASGLILNKMIGTGIFISPAVVLAATESKGMSLVLWIIGCLITTSGLCVYLEYGIRWPVTGGELLYIHNVFTKPPFLLTYVFGMMFVVLGGTHANALTFGKQVVLAGSPASGTVDHRLQKVFAILLITFVCQLQAFSRVMNIRVHNLLAAYKVGLLLFVSVTGWVAIAGKRTAAAAAHGNPVYGKENLTDIFQVGSSSPYAYSLALLNIIRAFLGYENANFVLEEVQQPPRDRMRTFRRAVTLSVFSVCFLYMMVNVAFFAACTKEDLIKSPETLALFFSNVFGPSDSSRKASAVLLALSAAGNVMALTFGYVRVKQEIARIGCVVYPEFWAKTSEHGTPAGALFLHWLFSCLLVLICPLDHANGFLTLATLYPYTHTWISILLGIGLLGSPWIAAFKLPNGQKWKPQSSIFGYWLLVPMALVFILGNLFILVLCWWPANVQKTLETKALTLPPYAGPIAGTSILLAGVAYWLWDLYVLPYFGYNFFVEEEIDAETKIVKVKYLRLPTGVAQRIRKSCQPIAEKVIKKLKGD